MLRAIPHFFVGFSNPNLVPRSSNLEPGFIEFIMRIFFPADLPTSISALWRGGSGFVSPCGETATALFLLALEPGCFLLCQGWDDWFGYKLGLPAGPAARSMPPTVHGHAPFCMAHLQAGRTGPALCGGVAVALRWAVIATSTR